jgi:antitoxin component of RelBE/YafQ-DinJ toxin-antitoxin module
MTTRIIFNADPKVKAKAMANAKKQGITISYYLNSALAEFAEGSKKVEIVEQVNEKTLREIKKAYKEAKAGIGISPTFTNADEALHWLHSK